VANGLPLLHRRLLKHVIIIDQQVDVIVVSVFQLQIILFDNTAATATIVVAFATLFGRCAFVSPGGMHRVKYRHQISSRRFPMPRQPHRREHLLYRKRHSDSCLPTASSEPRQGDSLLNMSTMMDRMAAVPSTMRSE
jgi:hypothetical protein